MSLKAFHIFFVVVCVLFLAGFGVWSTQSYLHGGGALSLALGGCAIAGSVLLAVYGRWFVKKLSYGTEL